MGPQLPTVRFPMDAPIFAAGSCSEVAATKAEKRTAKRTAETFMMVDDEVVEQVELFGGCNEM